MQFVSELGVKSDSAITSAAYAFNMFWLLATTLWGVCMCVACCKAKYCSLSNSS